MTEEDITYYRTLAYYAIGADDENIGSYAKTLLRHLDKRKGLVLPSAISKLDEKIGSEVRTIERYRSSSTAPELLVKLVSERSKTNKANRI